MENFAISEYKKLREEITERAKMLHQMINLSVLLLFSSAIFTFLLVFFDPTFMLLRYFVLSLPIIFSLLTFNYQANQATLEAIAKYLNTDFKKNLKIPKETIGWDDFYNEHKKQMRMASFLKVVPLLLPQLIPFLIIILSSAPISAKEFLLFWTDIVLFIIVIYNFRYKLK